MSKEDIKLIWQTINCEACYNENMNYCKEKCECKCKEFKALENILSQIQELGEINFNLLNNGVPKEEFDELRLKLKKEKNENEANKKRIEELEEENKMFKEFYRACGSTDIAENITATRYTEIRRQGYMKGVAERDKLAKEICKDCCKKNKKDSIPKAKVEEIIQKLDIDIERNKRRKAKHNTEQDTDIYSNILIAYEPETIKQILEELLKDGGE